MKRKKEDPADYAVKKLAQKDYTRAKLAEQMKKKFSEKEAENTAEKMSEYGYINEERQIEREIEKYRESSPRSVEHIKEELAEKGFPQELISKHTAALKDRDLASAAFSLVQKKLKGKKDLKTKQKICNSLLAKGFDYDIIIDITGFNFDQEEQI